ncbi:CAP domain-containing protein [Luoshenia tenuis]|nr:CAP domain-containing protein [Luoshenia tenuis]
MHRSMKTILAGALTATLLLAGAPTGQAAARGVNYYGLNRCAIRFIAIYRCPQLRPWPGCAITIKPGCPSLTPRPTQGPQATPSATPTQTPQATPSATATPAPSAAPTAAPSAQPTPTERPTATPQPSAAPSATATPKPSAKPTATPSAQPTTTPEASGSMTALEQSMLNMVNEERAKQGLSALQVDPTVQKVARLKAQDMVNNNYFAHESPTYGDIGSMLSRYGVSYRSAGENIAKNANVEKAHVALMNSAGHKANILGKGYTHVGIGIVTDANGYVTLAQVFVGK